MSEDKRTFGSQEIPAYDHEPWEMTPKKSLEDMLQKHTIAELKGFLKEMALKIKSGIRKDVMVRSVSKWILSNPETLVMHLFTYELRMYDELINHPERGLLIPAEIHRLPFDFITVVDGELRSYVAPDLAEKLKPILADTISYREKSGEEAIENHILGLLNLRGSMRREEYESIVVPFVDEDAAHEYIFERFIRLAEDNNMDEEIVIVSPFIANSDFNVFDADCVDPEVDPKDFTKDEIAQAATLPYPRIGGVARESLKKGLLKLGRTENEAEDFLFSRWIRKQTGSSNLLQGIQSALDDMDITYEQIQDFLPLLTDYENKMPYWKFKGWSSSEIAAKEPLLKPGEMPRISIGPNLRARGITSFEQIQEMAARGEDFPDMPMRSTKKVGRNEPCPCGSGRKYKHCCGR